MLSVVTYCTSDAVFEVPQRFFKTLVSKLATKKTNFSVQNNITYQLNCQSNISLEARYRKNTLHVLATHHYHISLREILRTINPIKLKQNIKILTLNLYTGRNVHISLSLSHSLSLSLSKGATAQGGPRPPLGVSSILPGLGRLLSNFYILASLHLPPLHLPNAVWVSLWGVFLLAH